MFEESFDFAAIVQLLRLGDLSTPVAVRAASSLCLADHFDNGTRSAQELGASVGVRPDLLTRLLRVLARAGLVSQDERGGFALTAVGHALRCDEPLSMRDAFTLAFTELRAWGEFEHCVRTGESGFQYAFGESHRSYRARNAEEDRRMDLAHKAASRLELLVLSAAYPWAQARSIVDVGGGTGMFLAGILQRFTRQRGTLFDLPRMIEDAPALLHEYGVADRCSLVSGSFFETVPTGGDLYLLKAVVGGWDDECCVKILRSIRSAMPDHGRLLIIEPMAGQSEGFSRGNTVQLYSLVLYGGKDRTLEDYYELAKAAGLMIERVKPRATLSIIELAKS